LARAGAALWRACACPAPLPPGTASVHAKSSVSRRRWVGAVGQVIRSPRAQVRRVANWQRRRWRRREGERESEREGRGRGSTSAPHGANPPAGERQGGSALALSWVPVRPSNRVGAVEKTRHM
jgi:hypothetical protein